MCLYGRVDAFQLSTAQVYGLGLFSRELGKLVLGVEVAVVLSHNRLHRQMTQPISPSTSFVRLALPYGLDSKHTGRESLKPVTSP